MLSFSSDAKAVLAAMNKSQAIIEFELDGTILTANENFCSALGYQLSEIKGKHHSMFVEASFVNSKGYKDFWSQLSSGQFVQEQFKRIHKDGHDVWIEASYNPVFKNGKPYKVVKFATDITATKIKSMQDNGKIDALSRSQAIIEFEPGGKIITANENFCNALGYSLSEIAGKHHSMFCEPSYVNSDNYRRFWAELDSGTFQSDEFLRIGKGGKEIWIQATYNPIFDENGKVFRVVKFATDITGRVNAVHTLGNGLQELADGNLQQRINTKFPENLESLRADFNNSVSRLETTMSQISSSSQAIEAGSSEVRAGADDLAKRTEQQAASVEETAAALEEITTTVADSSQRANEAGNLVAKTKANAERSGEVVSEAIDAMSEIEDSSNAINSIIGVIDDIAFQTNLLALNAGVEAARAGEAGKGFAVVAQEVRELAQRSANAAKEIKELITKSGDQVRKGVNLVGNTGEVLKEIVTQIQEINKNVTAIVEAANEQTIGLKEINSAVNVMDQGTQQNAAMVEESNAASHALAGEAASLNELLSHFKVSVGGGSVSRTSPPAVKAAPSFNQSTARVPTPARPDSKPAASPARQMANKVASAFGAGGAATAAANEWEEF